ncbi:MAG: cysteine dioxygenase family protein [Saprospiraceae bacterium]
MKTLATLIQALVTQFETQKTKNVLEVESLFTSYNNDDWRNFMTKEDGKFKNTILFQNQQFKLILIHWDGKQKSKKHGHPQGGGLIKVLSGTLSETRFDPKDKEKVIGKHYYFKGSGTSYIHDDIAYHVVENPSVTPAISLHLYAAGVDVSDTLPRQQEVNLVKVKLKAVG